jgi:hypothetical protein
MRPYVRAWTFAWLCLVLWATCAVAADKPAGYVQEAKGAALVVRAGQSHPLGAKDPVFAGDSLATKAESSLQIMFADGTVLAMGPESLFSVDEFVNEWGQEKTLTNKMRFTYGPGVFRAITGTIANRNPAAFSVQTPLGAIGIRGTELGSTVQAPAEADGRPYGAALAGAFSGGANAAAAVASLRQAAMGAVSAEAHGHLNGSASRPLAFTDKLGKTVNMGVGQGVTVTRERGCSDAGPVSGALSAAVNAAPINTSAKTPSAFKSSLGDNPGSNNGGGNNGGSGGGGGCSP